MKKFYSFLAATAIAVAGSATLSAMPDDATVVLNPTTDSGWTRFTGPNNSGTVFASNTSHKPAGVDFSYTVWISPEAQKDLWLTTPSMELTAGMTYSLEFQYQTWSNFKLGSLEVYVVDEPVSSTSTIPTGVPVYTLTDVIANQNEWLQAISEGKIEGSGTKYIAFHVSGACQGRFSIADVWVYSVSSPDISLEPVEAFNQEDYTISDWSKYSGTGNSGTTFVNWTTSIPEGATYACSLWNYSATDKNLWLTTPAFELEAGRPYSLDCMFQTWDPFLISNFEIYLVDAPVSASNVAAVEASTPIYKQTDWKASKNEYVPFSLEDVIAGSGTKYLAFHVSGSCQGRFSIAKLTVYSNGSTVAMPLAPTDLKAVANADGELAVDLSWTLPTTDDNGAALEGDNAITAVNIYRDGNKIATLEGAVSTYTDTEVTGLTKGDHTYAVSVTTANGESPLTDEVESGYVGPWSFTELELTVSSDNPAPSTAWSYSRNNTSVIVRTNSATPGNGIKNSVQTWNNNSLSDVDVWISSPALTVRAGKSYKISFYYRFNPNIDTEIGSLTAYMSDSRAAASSDAAALALEGVKVLDVTAEKGTVNSSTPWVEVVYKGYFAETTPQYLNFHLTGNNCKGIFIAGLSVEEYAEKPFTPAAPTGLTVTAAAAQKLEVTLKWTNPTKDIDGIAFESGVAVEQVYVYRDGAQEPIATLEGNVQTFVDTEETGLTAGEHTYTVQAVVAGVVSAMSDKATVDWVGPVAAQSLPWTPTITGLSNDDFSKWWITVNNGGYYSPNWVNRPTGFWLNNSYGYAADSWLISAPISITSDDWALDIVYTITTTASGFTPDVQIGIVDYSANPTEFITSKPVIFGGTNTAELWIDHETAISLFAADDSQPQYRVALHDGTTSPSGTYNLVLSSLDVKAPISGIENVTVNIDSDIQLYDINGNRVNNNDNLPRGIYIIRDAAGHCTKVLK